MTLWLWNYDEMFKPYVCTQPQNGPEPLPGIVQKWNKDEINTVTLELHEDRIQEMMAMKHASYYSKEKEAKTINKVWHMWVEHVNQGTVESMINKTGYYTSAIKKAGKIRCNVCMWSKNAKMPARGLLVKNSEIKLYMPIHVALCKCRHSVVSELLSWWRRHPIDTVNWSYIREKWCGWAHT